MSEQPVMPRKANSITFRPTIVAKTVMPLDEYTPEELSASWYSPEELNEIKQGLRQAIKAMANNGMVMGDDDCSRGLESFTPEGSAMKKNARRAAWLAVFIEQDYQYEEGSHDPQAIADEYVNKTRYSQAMARVMGGSDEHAARQPICDKSFVGIPKAAMFRTGSLGVPSQRRQVRRFSSRAA